MCLTMYVILKRHPDILLKCNNYSILLTQMKFSVTDHNLCNCSQVCNTPPPSMHSRYSSLYPRCTLVLVLYLYSNIRILGIF